MKNPRIAVIAFLLMSLTVLAGCGHDDAKDDDDLKAAAAADKEAKQLTPICPQVAIVRELATIEDYGRENPAPDQLVAGGRLRRIDGDCAYTKAGIDVKFELTAAAERGPRLGGDKVEFPYFIAVVDPQQAILTKDTMPLVFKFPSDKKIADTLDTLHVFIPLTKAARKTGPNYQVLIGFQLSQEQLDAARKK